MSERVPYHADIVVPCFDEAEVLPHTVPALYSYFAGLVRDKENGLVNFRLILIDDGSRDRTWPIIAEFAQRFLEIEGARMSRNFGHQAAMLAGLSMADADVVLTVDADLQDDIHAITAMLAAYEGGAHLALGVRSDRSADDPRKAGSARAYYRLLSLMGITIIENHADFRLMSRDALNALLRYREVNLFLRGLVPQLGFCVTLIPYTRQPRAYGETKYTLRKMIRLALDGITSFSIMPLRIIAFLGGLIFVSTMVLTLTFLVISLVRSSDLVPGWASTVLPMLFLGGMQLLSTGVLGEYIGKIYLETKRRPRFIIQQTTSPSLNGVNTDY